MFAEKHVGFILFSGCCPEKIFNQLNEIFLSNESFANFTCNYIMEQDQLHFGAQYSESTSIFALQRP